MESGDTRRAGRPRHEDVGPALLVAARELVIAHGYEAVSIQMIAAQAGVGRQSLYRRWSGKADLILEAFLESASASDFLQAGEPVQSVLTRFLRSLFANLGTDGPAIRSLIASAQTDREFLAIFKSRFAEPRAQIVAEIIRSGIANGEIDAEADIETAIAMVHGAFWYPLLMGQDLDPGYADRLVKIMMEGIGNVGSIDG